MDPNAEIEFGDAALRRPARTAAEAEPRPSEGAPAPFEPRPWGRYILIDKLATGGMAEVYLARHDGPHGFSKTMVLKRILPRLSADPQFLRMFLDEARVAALLEHPNLVSIHEAGIEPDYFIAMEHLDGPNLLRLGRAADEDPANYKIWARVIADACSGLDYAHGLRDTHGDPLHIVHRDVSLENIVLTYDGRVKVLDFGIAKADCIEARTAPGHVKGKFAYLAPEQFLGGAVDRRADVWALGVCLYRLCAGVRPFSGRNMAEMMQRVVSQDPPPLHLVRTSVPEALSRIAHRALRKRPEHRYATAQEMQDDLLEWVRGQGGITSRDLARFVECFVPRQARPRERPVSPPPSEGPLSEDIHLNWADAVSSDPRASLKLKPEPERTRRLGAWAFETTLALALLTAVPPRFAPLGGLLLLAFAWATLVRHRASPGEWLFGLEVSASQARGLVPRGLARFVAQHAWIALLTATLAAWRASPAGLLAVLLGAATLGTLATMACGSVPALRDRRTLHDRMCGLEVRRGRGPLSRA